MNDLEEARAYFAKDRYASEVTGVVIEEVGDRYAKCSLKIDQRHLNALDFLMGGVVYTMADLTFAVSTNFRAERPTVTNVAQVSYLNPLAGDPVGFGGFRQRHVVHDDVFVDFLLSFRQKLSVKIKQ